MSISLITHDHPQDFLEACDKIRSLQAEVEGTLNTIRQKGKDLILLRFDQGRIVDLALDMDHSENYGEEVVKTLAQRAGVHERTLYRCHQFFKATGVSDKVRLRKWMDNKEEELGKSISWSYCINWSQKALPASHKDAEEKLDKEIEKLDNRAQKLEQSALDLEKEAARYNDADKIEEAFGAVAKAREVADDVRRQAERLKLERPERQTDPRFLQMVREEECSICSNRANPHHLITVGSGGSDYTAVPLCQIHHREAHTMPLEAFEQHYDVNLWRINSRLLIRYLTIWPTSTDSNTEITPSTSSQNGWK